VDAKIKPVIGIISPFGVHCGIARAGQVSKDALKLFQIEILNLDRKILINDGKAASRKKAKEYLNSLISRANQCDLVVWQHEPGTLGLNWKEQIRVHRKLCSLEVPTIVELHTVVDFEKVSILGNQIKCVTKWIRHPRKIKLKTQFARITAQVWFWKSIYKGVSKLVSTSGAVIVHREIDREILDLHSNFKCLKIVNELDSLTEEMKAINEYDLNPFENHDLTRMDSIFESLRNEVILVQPGFISNYKCHSISLDVLRLLPDFVHLLIIGEIHGVTADSNPGVAEMTLKIQNQLSSKEFESILHRVHFFPNPTDIEIAAAIYSSDAVLLPYIETGQSGSGPLSESYLLGAQVICSNIPAFRNYQKFENNVHFHDTGNVFQIRDLVLSLYNLRKINEFDRRNVKYPWSGEITKSTYSEILSRVAIEVLNKSK